MKIYEIPQCSKLNVRKETFIKTGMSEENYWNFPQILLQDKYFVNFKDSGSSCSVNDSRTGCSINDSRNGFSVNDSKTGFSVN